MMQAIQDTADRTLYPVAQPACFERTRVNCERFMMKTHGEIEAAICEGVTRFEQEYMGRGPKHINAHLIGDLVVVRLQGVLTAAEHQLVTTLSPEKGRDLLKQVRNQLVETARPVLEQVVLEATGVATVSLHHDISVVTDEEVVLFTLADEPLVREPKNRIRS